MRRTYTPLPYTEYPVAEGNFGPESARKPIDTIILHSTNSTYQSAISWFGNPSAGTSAHYIIANDGRLAAMLEEYNVAYHAGNYDINQRSIGIEHEGFTGLVRSDKLYEASIKLVADICKFYNIPCDRTHIRPHREIVATACPTDLDVEKIVTGARVLLGGTPPVSDCEVKLEEITRDRNRLNDVIREKDEKLRKVYLMMKGADPSQTDPNRFFDFLMAEIPKTYTELTRLSQELTKCQQTPVSSPDCQNKLAKLQTRYDKLKAMPSKKQLDLLLNICEKLGISV